MTTTSHPGRIHGVWCRKNKTFYYLETGGIGIAHPVDRVKRVLTRRGLLTQAPDDFGFGTEPYKVMTLLQAQEATYKIEAIYLNNHVRRAIEDEKEATPKNPYRT
jgi:hypothetical protein